MAKRVLSSRAVWGGRFGALVALSLLTVSALTGQKPESFRILSHVKDLRQMSPADAARGAQVRIKGSVTALSGWKNSFFLQDASGGISVDRTDAVEVHAGDEVEVTGISGQGLFAPLILANHVQVLARKTLPPARPSFFADLAGGKQDGQRIELQGVVHSANVSESWGRPVLFLVVDIGGGSITARVHEFPRKDFQYLVDATVRMRGVSGTALDEKRQFIGARLFVPSMDDVQIDQTAPADPFAIPASTIQSLLRFGPAQGLSHRVRVSGILTGQRLGHTLYLQSGGEGIVVATSQPTRLKLGAWVEAVGFVVPGRYSPALHDAVFRKIEQDILPPAVPVAAADVIQVKDGFPFAPWNGLLVQLDGEIIDRTQHAGEEVWIMRDGNKVFQAQIQTGPESDGIAGIAVDSRVRVTGVCILDLDEVQQPRSFRIMLRSARDVAVLHKPRLTLAQFLWVAGGLVLLSLGTLGWIVRLRRPGAVETFEPAGKTVKLHEYCRWWARVAGLLTGCLGLIVLLGGWACNVAVLRSVLPGYASMRPPTALGLVLLGLALWLNDEDKAGLFKRCIVQICAGVPVLIGVVTLLEWVLGTNLHMGELMFRNSVLELAPARMAMMTAVDLVLLGCTLLCCYQRRGFVVCQYLVVTAGSLGLFNIIGYLYGIKSFYGLAFHTGPFFTTAMALHTAGAFMVLSAGILISRPNWGVMATITSEAPGGVIARRLLPCALVIPAALGWLKWQGQLIGLYDTAFGLTLLTSSNIVIFAFLIWRSGILLNRLDLARSGAENDLRESKASFGTLADAMPQIVWTAQPDGNRDYFNQRWYDFTGMTFDQTKGWGWQQVVHPEDIQRCTERWTYSFTTGTPCEVEYRFKRASDGIYRWYLGRAVAVCETSGKIVRWFGTCTDIDDYKQAEAENLLLNERLAKAIEEERHASKLLREHEEQMHQAFHAASLGTWQWDLASGSITCDRYFKKLWDLPPDTNAMHVEEFFAMIHPDDAEAVRQATKNAFDGVSEYNTEFRAIRPDGSAHWISARGAVLRNPSMEPLGMIGINMDISGRKEVEIALQESERQFVTLADTIPHLAWMAHTDGFIFWYNRRWYEFTGTTPAQMEGWGWQSVHDQNELPGVLERWQTSLRTAQPFEMEFPLLGGDGVFRWFLTRGTPVLGPEGKVVRWFGTNTDVTDIRQAHEKLRESEREVRALNESLESRVIRRTVELEAANAELQRFSHRLEESNQELQDFASVASHDLQEPLRKVQVFGDRLKTRYSAALDEQGLDFLQRMLNAARRMQSLVQDLLAYSRLTSRALPFVAVDLSLVTQEVLSDLEVSIAETAARVEVGDLPTIQADPVQMRQLLQNLIGNALKFRKEQQAPIVRVHARSDGHDDFFRLIVEDNGIGFDEKYLDRIFTVFQRLHGRAEYEGTGIGLAVCRKIAHRHGGEITAMSAPGQGATFVVTLPRRRHTIHQTSEFSDESFDMNQMIVLSAK